MESQKLPLMQSTIAFFIDAAGNVDFPHAATCSSHDDRLVLAAESHTFKIKMAVNPLQRKRVNMLIDKMYSGRGYETHRTMDDDPNKVTLVAYSQNRAVGTLSIRPDSRNGLFADETHHDELNRIRAQGGKLCEFTGFAIDPGIKSKRLLASLFHVAYLYPFRILGHSDGVLEVNPRHVKFYEKMLGFVRIGAERICPRANAASVLLRTNFANVAEQVKKYGGFAEKTEAEKLLYPYFFSHSMENIILSRLSADCA